MDNDIKVEIAVWFQLMCLLVIRMFWTPSSVPVLLVSSSSDCLASHCLLETSSHPLPAFSTLLPQRYTKQTKKNSTCSPVKPDGYKTEDCCKIVKMLINCLFCHNKIKEQGEQLTFFKWFSQIWSITQLIISNVLKIFLASISPNEIWRTEKWSWFENLGYSVLHCYILFVCLFLGSEGGSSDNPGLPCMFP